MVNKLEFEKEKDCYLYCIDNAFALVDRKEYAKAACYYENAARSLRELEKLKTSQESIAEILSIVGNSKVNVSILL